MTAVDPSPIADMLTEAEIADVAELAHKLHQSEETARVWRARGDEAHEEHVSSPSLPEIHGEDTEIYAGGSPVPWRIKELVLETMRGLSDVSYIVSGHYARQAEHIAAQIATRYGQRWREVIEIALQLHVPHNGEGE
ncbi:hypothetical protein [Amycolatopsis sp. DSM 110486]|uniref:hypothetical protein n=1 Tax=Amycolatopsis sp. DSM 110486 TaxID=2865832 RepID=UPI001C6A3A2F|nr:hypothetical protein [Amycolatopsis sp. DSM 110486]QYN17529.1 hypothetical protein K1T34_32610 [Amycolatopsis sp. DSM 110486]